MKRKIMLLLGSSVTLLLVFAVYHFSAGGLGRMLSRGRQPKPLDLTAFPPSRVDPNGGLGVDSAGAGLVIEKRDDLGRLEGIYQFPKWEKQPDGSYLVEDPNVVIYHAGGARTYVHARRGELFVEDLARGVDVRSGRLWGDVKVWFDSDPQAGPLAEATHERLRRVVRIHTEEVNFDNERLMMYTDSRIRLFSDKADIYGTGLVIRWREAPRELVRLEITRGELMAIYEIPDEFNVALPGTGAPSPSAATAPTTAGSDANEIQIAEMSVSRPVEEITPASRPVGTTAATQPRPRRNVYRTVFRGRVRVDYPVVREDSNRIEHGYMRGAETLALSFDWTEGFRRGMGIGADRRGRLDEEYIELARPPATIPSRPGPATASAPAGGPAEDKPPATAGVREPMIITWTGPLVLEPVGYTDKPSSRRYKVEAEGDRILLSDSHSIAECKRFAFAGPGQRGWLEGTDDSPARMILADGQEIACPRMEFHRRGGTARLIGRGYMARRLREANEAPDLEGELLAGPQTDPNLATDRITWTRSVLVNFELDERIGPDGVTRTREVLKDANFVGDVELVQADTGDFVRSKRLYAVMDRDAEGRAYVRKAVATGGVLARQQGTEMTGENVAVTFRPAEGEANAQPTTAAGRFASVQMGRVRPERLEADGNVLITDTSEDEPLTAGADRLTTDLIERTAVLYGGAEPAWIARGRDRFVGGEIHLREVSDGNRTEQAAEVRGAGTLQFMLKKDLNGVELANPRRVSIAWEEGMDYSGWRNEAVFRGNVRLDSNATAADGTGRDHMSCRKKMRVLFEKVAPATQPAVASAATAPADERRSVRTALRMDSYSRRRVAMIVADDNVVMLSSRQDPDGKLLRRLKVTGDRLLHDANSGETHVYGKGTMLAEDYRPPEPTTSPTPAAARPGEDIGRPNQTGFWWDKVMSLHQPDGNADGKVVLQGNVQMVHRSGRFVLSKGLNVPAWPVLKSGRVTTLGCNMLEADFAEADANATSRPASAEPALEGGPRIGPLVRFYAMGDVRLEDGDRQKRTATCQQLEYKREPDMVTLLGTLPGKPRAAAVLSYKDLDAQTRQEWASPKIVWYRKTDRVETEETIGGGIR